MLCSIQSRWKICCHWMQPLGPNLRRCHWSQDLYSSRRLRRFSWRSLHQKRLLQSRWKIPCHWCRGQADSSRSTISMLFINLTMHRYGISRPEALEIHLLVTTKTSTRSTLLVMAAPSLLAVGIALFVSGTLRPAKTSLLSVLKMVSPRLPSPPTPSLSLRVLSTRAFVSGMPQLATSSNASRAPTATRTRSTLSHSHQTGRISYPVPWIRQSRCGSLSHPEVDTPTQALRAVAASRLSRVTKISCSPSRSLQTETGSYQAPKIAESNSGIQEPGTRSSCCKATRTLSSQWRRARLVVLSQRDQVICGQGFGATSLLLAEHLFPMKSRQDRGI